VLAAIEHRDSGATEIDREEHRDPSIAEDYEPRAVEPRDRIEVHVSRTAISRGSASDAVNDHSIDALDVSARASHPQVAPQRTIASSARARSV
jgi:hypothetical protein